MFNNLYLFLFKLNHFCLYNSIDFIYMKAWAFAIEQNQRFSSNIFSIFI